MRKEPVSVSIVLVMASYVIQLPIYFILAYLIDDSQLSTHAFARAMAIALPGLMLSKFGNRKLLIQSLIVSSFVLISISSLLIQQLLPEMMPRPSDSIISAFLMGVFAMFLLFVSNYFLNKREA